MARTVLIGIDDNQGYAPDQISTAVTLEALLESVQNAIEEFGADAKVVLYNGQRYGQASAASRLTAATQSSATLTRTKTKTATSTTPAKTVCK